MLVATCSAFTEYSYAFVQTDADILGTEHHDQAVALNDRALRLYLRGRDYCLRAMEVRFPGITGKLMSDPDAALKRAEKKDVPMLYWTAASWGAAVSLGIDKPDIVVDFPTVRALADRALALDGTWNKGAIDELMITLDSLPEALGGNADRARQHFTRAVALQKGASPGPYVALAEGVSVPAQNRAEYERLLHQAHRDRSGEGPVEPARHVDRTAARAGAARSGRYPFFEVTPAASRHWRIVSCQV